MHIISIFNQQKEVGTLTGKTVKNVKNIKIVLLGDPTTV
jgi:hypothetical protein